MNDAKEAELLAQVVRRGLLACVALQCVAAGCATAQAMDSTRWAMFTGEQLEALITDLFATVSVAGDSQAVARVVGAADRLELGEEARLRFVASNQDDVQPLYVDLANELYTYVRFRSSGRVFEAAETVFRKHWIRSLRAIEGLLELSVVEAVPAGGGIPELVLSLQTAREFGCLGYQIEADLARETGADGESLLRLQLLGISPPGGICAQAFGPADLRQALPAERGRYTLRITYADQADVYALTITDSTVLLVPRQASFTNADTRLLLRRPPRSFAFYCGTTTSAAELCTDIHHWLARQPGIEPMSFPEGGVIPYSRGIGTQHQARHYYRYAGEEALEAVERCFSEIRDQVREAVGIVLTIETWTGRLIQVMSQRSLHERHIEAPLRVTTSCEAG